MTVATHEMASGWVLNVVNVTNKLAHDVAKTLGLTDILVALASRKLLSLCQQFGDRDIDAADPHLRIVIQNIVSGIQTKLRRPCVVTIEDIVILGDDDRLYLAVILFNLLRTGSDFGTVEFVLCCAEMRSELLFLGDLVILFLQIFQKVLGLLLVELRHLHPLDALAIGTEQVGTFEADVAQIKSRSFLALSNHLLADFTEPLEKYRHRARLGEFYLAVFR